MKRPIPATILFGILIIFCCSCKKDLDHDLNYNIFDSAYVGTEPVIVEEFTPIFSTVHQRNILRIKIKYNTHIKDSRAYLYKNGVVFAWAYTDTTTILTDFYILPGQTCSYQAMIKYKTASSALSDSKAFTMY
jgi:hypothetical protein